MKKTLAFLFMFVAAYAANAASINWTITGNTTTVLYGIGENGSSSTTPYQGTVYLILADATSLNSLQKTSVSEFESALSAITLNDSYSTANGTKPTVTKVAVSSSLLTAGQNYTFGLLVYDTDSTGSVSYKVVTANQIAYADGASAQDQKLVQTAWAKIAADSQSPWTTAVSVPEPSSAALALAGLALLLKRRKA